MSCARAQHCAPGEDLTRDLAIKSPTLSQLSYRCSPTIRMYVNEFHALQSVNIMFSTCSCNYVSGGIFVLNVLVPGHSLSYPKAL